MKLQSLTVSEDEEVYDVTTYHEYCKQAKTNKIIEASYSRSDGSTFDVLLETGFNYPSSHGTAGDGNRYISRIVDLARFFNVFDDGEWLDDIGQALDVGTVAKSFLEEVRLQEQFDEE